MYAKPTPFVPWQGSLRQDTQWQLEGGRWGGWRGRSKGGFRAQSVHQLGERLPVSALQVVQASAPIGC